MSKKGILCITVLLVFTVSLTGLAFAKNSERPPLKVLLVGYGWYAGIPEGQINNAETIARSLNNKMILARDAKGRVVAQGKITSLIVPVTWEGAFPPVIEAIQSLKPDIVVGLGTYPGAPGISPEPVASNFEQGCDANPSDPTDVDCRNQPIVNGGAPYRYGTLPYNEMVIAMNKAGIPSYKGQELPYVQPGNPVGWCDYPQCPYPPGYTPDNPGGDPQPSATPGWYLCNFMLYNLSMYQPISGVNYDFGFIHVPTRHEYATKNPSDPDFMTKITEWVMPSMEMSRMIKGIEVSLGECVRARAGE